MKIITRELAVFALSLLLVPFGASAQDSSIYVQCPETTRLHPRTQVEDPVNPGNFIDRVGREPGIKCDHLGAGDGMVSMAADDNVGLDGNLVETNARKPLYIFGFSRIPLPEEALAMHLENQSTGIADISEYPGYVMDQGMMAANAPAPTISVDEDDEFFLSLTNVGMAMRPDLFDPHTVHWHGFPNASAVFDGLPESGISIAGGATLTYYYNAKDAGTYMYHCHVEATEHMQMGMLGSLFVRPRQDRCQTFAGLDPADPMYGKPGTTCPAGHDTGLVDGDGNPIYRKYAFNDGDGSTHYDSEIAIQFGSFDPDFHDLHIAVQPLPFAAMRDRYFLLNGRGYPDTVETADIHTVDPLGKDHASQPIHTLIETPAGKSVLLRLSNLSVTAFYTVGTSGIDMKVVGLDARLLRDDDGNNMAYTTNSVTLGGGQSADVIITPTTPGTYFLYTKNLDLLANDAENFGGMMTEIRVSAPTI